MGSLRLLAIMLIIYLQFSSNHRQQEKIDAINIGIYYKNENYNNSLYQHQYCMHFNIGYARLFVNICHIHSFLNNKSKTKIIYYLKKKRKMKRLNVILNLKFVTNIMKKIQKLPPTTLSRTQSICSTMSIHKRDLTCAEMFTCELQI